MENGERRELTPTQPQRDPGAAEKPGKIFMTDDEGIGGSENNTPRPGSAMADSRPPASTAPGQVLNPSPTKRQVRSPPQPTGARSAGSPLRPKSAASSGSSFATGSVELSAANDESEIDAVARFNNSHLAHNSHDGEAAAHGGGGGGGGSGDDDSLGAVNGYAVGYREESQTGVSEDHTSSPTSAQQSGPNPAEESATGTPTQREGSGSPPLSRQQSDAAENMISKQLQQAMLVLEDYQGRLKQEEEDGAATGLAHDETLKMTLETVTSLCQACSSTSASLGKHLQQARQLTDSISKELSYKLQSTDLKDWIPSGYCDAEKAAPEEQRQAADKERMARAAEARAAVARASHTMQTKTQELAQAEAEMVEAELAAAAAKEVAEEAVLRLETAQAALEAKQQKEEEEEEREVAKEREAGEDSLQGSLEKAETSTDLKQEEESSDQQRGNVEDQQGQEHTLLEEENADPQQEVNSQGNEAITPPQSEEQVTAEANTVSGEREQEECHYVEHAQNGSTENQQMDQQSEDRLPVAQDNDELAENEAQQSMERGEDVGQHIEYTAPRKEHQPEPELTTQKVFQEVHVVHEGHNGFSHREHIEKPDQWPRFIYSLEPGDWDTGLGCVVRAASTALGRDDLEVTRVHTASVAVPLHDSEELISNIVRLAPSRPDGGLPDCSPFLSVCLPHCSPRLHPGREPAVRMRPFGGGGWRDVPTHDIIFDDIKEHRFVEARVQELGTLCVVLRLKRDTVHLTRHSGKAMSSADSRVTLTWPRAAVKTSANITMAVQLLDHNVVTELRTRSDADCGHLVSSSPILHCQSQGAPLQQPLIVTLPCPPNHTVRPQRPASSIQRKSERVDTNSAGGGGAGGGGGGDQRPATARPFFAVPKKAEEVLEDEVHVLWRREGGTWSKLQDVNFLLSKKKDIIIFELHQIVARVMLLRTHTGLSQGVVERTAQILEHLAALHTVQLLLRQHVNDPSQLLLTCFNAHNAERTLKSLKEEGFKQGPSPSGEVKLREGQLLELGFRGNIQPLESSFVRRCVFHSNIPFRVQFSVTEIDRFAQKGFSSYRGFVQLSTTYSVPFRRMDSMFGVTGSGGQGCPAFFISGKHLLAELMASLPKPEPESPRPLNTAPVLLKSYGPVTNDLLRHVAQQLAADDWRRMAPILNIRRTRLQAILRQNVGSPAWLPIYDVLLTWSKRLPQAFDRVEVLCTALIAVGRNDLAEEVRDKDNSFRQEHVLSAREVLLNKAFVRIARHEKAVGQWRRLALFLGLSEEQIEDITNRTCSARERCIQSLQHWKDLQDETGELATSILLAHKLRLCRYRALAREIESIR